jgi:hypothetical protein
LELEGEWACAEITVSYNVIPLQELGPKRKRTIVTDFYNSPTVVAGKPTETVKPANSDGLTTNGVMLRGISFGNAQDMVLNSSLNLRMSGKLADNLTVEAALTDQEYPFQPEGTTTTLQDFDRIYIKAYSKNLSVLLGDHAFTGQEGAFYSKFAKKNRGMQILLNDTFKKWKTTAGIDGSIARGRFARNEIKGTEGLQGPYRLTGAGNESFIIIVSGTEVVYLDGEKMERGYQADYIIDYNLGEITFTPKRIIGQNNRIVVEFQYTDRFYSRVIGAAHGSMDNGKIKFLFSTYTESDLKNQPIQQDLDLFDSTTGLNASGIMALAGDNPALASMPGARKSTGFNPGLPNYRLKDSAGNQYYEYTTIQDSLTTYFNVQFTYTGPGGDYIIAATSANGKVYKYAGAGKGEYKPLILLRTPNRSSLHEAGFQWTPLKNQVLKISLATSGNDRNLFSSLDDKYNTGRAVSLDWQAKHSLKNTRDSTKKHILIQSVKAEWTGNNFQSIERFRDVEFNRLWNRDLHNPESTEGQRFTRYIIHQSALDAGNFKADTRLGINETNGLTAANAGLNLEKSIRNWYIKPGAEISSGEFTPYKNLFKRFKAEGGYRSSHLKVNALIDDESSLFTDAENSDSIWSNSYRFQRGRLNAEKQSGRFRFNAYGELRNNFSPDNNSMQAASQATTAGADFSISGQTQGSLKAGAWIRKMELLDSAFVNLFPSENHFSSRVEWSFPHLLKSLGGNLFWQSIAGREQERQFSYFEVPAGRGYFSWIDFNDNGIQEINEFVDAPFRDQARFIRLLIPTGRYIRAQNSEWSGNLTYSPTWKLGNVSFKDRLSWNLSSRNTAAGLAKYIPGLSSLNNDDLIAANYLFRNQAELVPEKGQWLLQYTGLQRGNKNMFTNGPEYRKASSHSIFSRINVKTAWQIRTSFERKQSFFFSAFLPGNNFNYRQLAPDAELVWQPGPGLRITTGAKLGIADSMNGVNLSQLLELRFGLSRSIGKNGMLDIKSAILNYDYNGAPNTPLSFDLMQGFTNGQNIRINLDLRFSASKNIQVLCGYESRKSETVRWIHIGRAEARYLF